MRAHAIDLAGLYTSEHGRLKRLVSRLVGNRATAEDLVHQAFIKLLAQADRDDFANCPAYLTSAVRNLAFNHIRDTARHAEVKLPDAEFHEIPDTAASPEIITLYRCELRRVLRAVMSLPPRRREVFVLNKFEGMSYDEIALRQGISRNTVISQIVSALADLDRLVGQR